MNYKMNFLSIFFGIIILITQILHAIPNHIETKHLAYLTGAAFGGTLFALYQSYEQEKMIDQSLQQKGIPAFISSFFTQKKFRKKILNKYPSVVTTFVLSGLLSTATTAKFGYDLWQKNKQANLKQKQDEAAQLEANKQKNKQSQEPVLQNIYLVGTHETQGARQTMEDAHCAEKLDENNQFFGIFDGHGGETTAHYCAKHLHENLKNNQHFTTNPEQALTEAFKKTHEDFKSQCKDQSGSTAITVLLQQNKIITANAGDARAILATAGKAKRLSYDHKPENKEEIQRIINANGFVWPAGSSLISLVTGIDPNGNPIFKQDKKEIHRVNGNLAVSRALGDYELNGLVIPDPYTATYQCTGDEEFIVLACDGLFDIIEDQALVDIVHYKLNEYKKSNKEKETIATEISNYLTQLASGKINPNIQSNDNVTVTVILLPKILEALKI